MRIPRALSLSAAALTAVLGLPAPAATAATGDTLYVTKASANCSDSGPGSQARPFCTIGAAAAVAEPGQTVRVSKDTYVENVRITRSGSAQAPITFLGGSASLEGRTGDSAAALTLSGAQHVVIRDFGLRDVLIENSTGITLDRNSAAAARIKVGAGNRNVSVTRNHLNMLAVDGGSTGVVLSNNALMRSVGVPIVVSRTPGVVITNNTVGYGCGPGIKLFGGSTGAAIHNNIVVDHGTDELRSCVATEEASELQVAADSVPGTVADYNLLRAGAGWVPYGWGDAKYATVEAFHAATGQGANDLIGDPRLRNVYGPVLNDCDLVSGKPDPATCSPAIDSAKADAPGVLDSDIDGNLRVDHPYVANRGTGHLDRGAAEVSDELEVYVTLAVDQSWAPAGTKLNFTAHANNRWPGTLRYTYDFGDGTSETTGSPTASHTYAAACACVPKLTVTDLSGKQSDNKLSDPFRVTAPDTLTARLDVTDVRPTKTDWSATAPFTVRADARASATDSSWPIVNYAYDFGDGYQPSLSLDQLEHTYRQPGDYTVTVTTTDSQGHKSTTSTVHQVRYLAGRYTTVKPYRALDTRTNQYPVGSVLPRTLNLSSWGHSENNQMSDGMTAVVLNVTATQATQDTYLTLYPSGQARPTASNLNIKAGQTVANLVTVPVGYDRSVEIYNPAGSVDVIVDVLGYYQPDTGNGYSPTGPTRLLDTRAGDGQPDTRLTPSQVREVQVTGQAGVPNSASAVVLNLTVTEPSTGGYLAAYPHGNTRPNVSSVNFTAGQTVANQAIVPIGGNGKIDLFNGAGDTHVIADVVGYYSWDSKGEFMPVTPTRLTDTRANNAPLGAGGELAVQVGGANAVPNDAIAAVLNVTATEPTTAGFLTVWPDGTARPNTSVLNFLAGQTVPNHVLAPLGNGRARVYNPAGRTHVIADLSGYFTSGR
ncbi:hypothetical protein GCM10009664_06660 [Kitasatospora gansuensis]